MASVPDGSSARFQAGGVTAGDSQDQVASLGDMIVSLLEFKWLILSVMALSVIAGVFVAFTNTPGPVYRADALVQVDQGGAGLGSIPGLPSLFNQSASVTAEAEILRSRTILGRVVDQMDLQVRAEPLYAPVVGHAIARRHRGATLREPLFGLDEYAWGGERIQVEHLDLPPALIGHPLTLLAGDNGAFSLVDSAGTILLEGSAGGMVLGDGISIEVAELRARPGTQFLVRRVGRDAAIGDLRSRIVVEEVGRSGMLRVALTGPDPHTLPEVLNEIINTYVRQNIEYRSSEAGERLDFLEAQLPIIQSQVDAAQAAHNEYLRTRGSVSLTSDTQNLMRSIVEVERELVRLEQERELIRQRFTERHPDFASLDPTINQLLERRARLERDLGRLPEDQQTAAQLQRDVDSSRALYNTMLQSAQQLRMARAGAGVSDVRIIDTATVSGASFASAHRAVLISVFFGVLLSLGLVFFIRALRVAVDDPETLEKRLGLPVYTVIPHSKSEKKVGRASRQRKGSASLLALTNPEDEAMESLRALRTWLHYVLADSAQGSSVLITGSGKEVGKSFVSKNLAVVLAQSGKRVVLIDGDLRKGTIHRAFGLPRDPGITEFFTGQAELKDVLRPTPQDGLTVLTTGQLPPNPSEMLMQPGFENLLKQLASDFDFLIIDGPPVLAVSDAAILGRYVAATLLVARAGRHPVSELEQAIKRLAKAGVDAQGFIFNDLDVNRQRYAYGSKGYVYTYDYKP